VVQAHDLANSLADTAGEMLGHARNFDAASAAMNATVDVAIAAGTGGAIGVLAGGAIGTGAGIAAGETSTLYRAVGTAEASQIARTGAFETIPGIETKYFATSAEDAAAWASDFTRSSTMSQAGPYSVIEAEFPTSVVNGAYHGFADGRPFVNMERAQLGTGRNLRTR
jgi:hypothetical protein